MEIMPIQRPSFFKKKSFIAAVAVCMLAIGAPAALADEPTLLAVKSELAIWANGKKIVSDKQPVIIGDRVYLPLRAIGEALGKQIDWNEWDQTIMIKDLQTFKEPYDWKHLGDLDKGIKEGGFSGLHLPNDPDKVFYTIGDRGSNGQVGK